jgi:lysophospholipase
MIPIDGGRHELLQEADHYRAQAIAAIEAFIPGSGATTAITDMDELTDHTEITG